MAQSAIIEAARIILHQADQLENALAKYGAQATTLGALQEETRNGERTVDEVRAAQRPLEDIRAAMNSLNAAVRRSMEELGRLQGTNP